MSLSHEWALLMAALQDAAPVTARTIRPPASRAAVKRAQTATAPWPPELHEFFNLHDGQNDVGGGGSVLPAGGLIGVSDIPARHAGMVAVMTDVVAAYPDVYGGSYDDIVAEFDQAGIEADNHLFLPGYVPIAAWDSNYTFCDTRSGEMCGCVSYRSSDGGHMGIPTWDSLEAMVGDVRLAVTDQRRIGWYDAAIKNGALQWDIAA